ncbi:MAG: TOTE conflict system archaeo-eukaryotic primase domain-containing protein [Planctomycetota bacterium]
MEDRAGSHGTGTRREFLSAKIARAETESRAAAARLRALRAELAALDSPRQITPGTHGTLTPEDKIALFRSLFRGRTDVFPKLWINSRKGRKGYAPACPNEWVRGVCEKPRVKCGECPHQAFIAVTDRALRDNCSKPLGSCPTSDAVARPSEPRRKRHAVSGSRCVNARGTSHNSAGARRPLGARSRHSSRRETRTATTTRSRCWRTFAKSPQRGIGRLSSKPA